VTTDPVRLERALAQIDRANAEDPEVVDLAGARGPKELLAGRRVCEWIQLVDPDASDEQLIAGRAHHLRRWLHPRDDHPTGRAGYLRWRAAAKRAHGEEVAVIVAEAGYDEGVAAEVGSIVRKEGLGVDPRVQVHEDALCLTFLESQLDELADRLGDAHVVEVLAKTAAKMSPGAVALAAELPLSPRGRSLLARALA
jgi:hypothetical protein